jgi:RNA-directed DNA polymerase
MTDWYQQWRQEQERRRLEREQRRRERPLRDRVYFGEESWGVSPEHRERKTDEDRLRHFDLPLLHSEQALAAWLDIPLTRLRWFTHDRPADTVWHYVAYYVPKRSGGQRLILAPKRELKALQHHILHHLLARVPVTEVAHGFVPGRSIVSNAEPHVGKAFVLNFDLADFFPSITFPRVRGLFLSLGYSFSVASVLALLCTEHEREAFDHDGKRYFISVGPRHLVQGAPTSPALANLVAARLDRRLDGLARAEGFRYTRYADDLTFSGDDMSGVHTLLRAVPRIVADESFVVHEGKTRLFRRSSRQVVTGLVVNEQLGTPRELRRRVRAILHNARHSGLEAQNHEGRGDFRGYLQGLIGFIHEANPEQARELREVLATL